MTTAPSTTRTERDIAREVRVVTRIPVPNPAVFGAASQQEGSTMDIRYHSSDDMDGLTELASITEPVAVVLRPDGSADVYGCIAVSDQRPLAREMTSGDNCPGYANANANAPLCGCGGRHWHCPAGG